MVRLAQMLEKRKAKASQPILMGDEQARNLSLDNGVYEPEKPCAFTIEAAPDFHDPLIHHQLLGNCVALSGGPLVLYIRPPSRARHPARGHRSADGWPLRKGERRRQVGFIRRAPPRKRSFRFETAFPIPALQGVDADTHLPGKLCD